MLDIDADGKIMGNIESKYLYSTIDRHTHTHAFHIDRQKLVH